MHVIYPYQIGKHTTELHRNGQKNTSNWTIHHTCFFRKSSPAREGTIHPTLNWVTDVHQLEQKKHTKLGLFTPMSSSLWTEETIKQRCIFRAESDLPHIIVFYKNCIKTWLQIKLICKLLVLIHAPSCPFSSSSSVSCLYINHSSPDLYTQVSSPIATILGGDLQFSFCLWAWQEALPAGWQIVSYFPPAMIMFCCFL